MTSPDSTARATAIVMISVLARQLENWINHARDLKYATREFKYELGITSNALRSLLNHLNKVARTEDDENFFELSAQYSEMVEKIICIESEEDLTEVMQLIESKIRTHEQNTTLQQAS